MLIGIILRLLLTLYPKAGLDTSLAKGNFGGQGVCREAKSEGYAEKYRAVVEGAILMTNWSAKDGIRSSLHYEGEGILIQPIVPRCVQTARYGRTVCVTPGGLVQFSGGTEIRKPIS